MGIKKNFKKFVNKNIYKRWKYMDKTRIRFLISMSFVLVFLLFVGGTYSYFAITKNLNSAIITIADLKYELKSEDTNYKNNSITVKAGETIKLTLSLKSLNKTKTKYALTENHDNTRIKVYYVDYLNQNVEGIIGELNSVIDIKIAIKNESTSDGKVDFGLNGGYLHNDSVVSNITKKFGQDGGIVTQIIANIIDGRELPNSSEIKTGEPSFSDTAPVISNYKSNLSGSEVTKNLSDSEKNLYYFYADSYSFNSSNGLYTLNNPKSCRYSECVGLLKGKYLLDYRGIDSQDVISTTDVGVIYKVSETSTQDKLVYQSHYQQSNLYDSSLDGIYKTDDDYGISYYFRGDIKNNYVKFGTWKEGNKKGSPMYWRIMRINGNGSLRLIYDGTSPYDNNVPSQDRMALTDIAWNKTNFNDEKYVGYMYGGLNGEVSGSRVDIDASGYSNSKNAIYNQTDSNVKTELDTWYDTNLSDVDEYIEDSIFCNDRSIGSRGGPGYGNSSTATFYSAYDRLKTNKKPSLKCPNRTDAFTVSDTEKGNGALTRKIGLPSADEVVFAGATNGKSNGSFYMYKGYWYRLMSPYAVTKAGGAGMMFVDTAGNPLSNRVDEIGDIAPVINLKGDFAKNLSGDGTKDNPYQEGVGSTKVTFMLSFDANGGNVDEKTKEVETETTYGTLPIPTRDNHIFIGWYTEREGGNLIVENSSVLQAYKTLYAHWKPAYKITFDPNGGSVDVTEKLVAYSDAYGDLPRPKRDNYIFTGWYTERENGSKVDSDDAFLLEKNQTLYAHWTQIPIIARISKALSSNTQVPASDEIKKGNPDFSQISSNDKGIYSMEDDYGTSYYFRGAVENNYVKFAGFYWRIIRVNGNGSVRMIYDGKKAFSNGEGQAAFNSAWNSDDTDAKYAGYMFGGANGEVSEKRIDLGQSGYANSKNAIYNQTNTTIKTKLEEWYVTNIKNTGYDSYVSDEIFCNDRTLADGLGYGSSNANFEIRLRSAGSTVTFACKNRNDAFTVNETTKGNGKLSEKVGMITADEAHAAGSISIFAQNTPNEDMYLTKNQPYWTISPYIIGYNQAGVHILLGNGLLDNYWAKSSVGVSPVINLSAEYFTSLDGLGTMDNPFQSF